MIFHGGATILLERFNNTMIRSVIVCTILLLASSNMDLPSSNPYPTAATAWRVNASRLINRLKVNIRIGHLFVCHLDMSRSHTP